ncbi:NET1-associated nuclear protein 1, partial [Spiromyces aspiralis]
MSNTCIGLSLSTDGQWLASFSRFKLYLTHFQPGEKRVQHKWEFNERLSTVAFHPTEPYLALGDWRGRIILWYGMDPLDADTTNRAISKRSLHWHSRRVHSVAFSPDGKHMLSGGEEGVLVIWQLDTDKRTFISRLGADLMGVTFSPDQLYYGITLNDNTVKVYSAVNRSLVSVAQGLQLAGHLLQAKTATSSALKSKYKAAENKLSRALQGDLCDPTYTGPTTNKKLSDEQHDEAMQLLLLPNRLTTGLAVHPITNHVTLNGEAGLLQVYNPVSDRHVFTIEVAPFNHTSGSTPEGGIKLPHVESVKYSSDGQWMVT